jgi:type I restriction enzyme S subunit
LIVQSVPLKHLCLTPPEYGLNVPSSAYVPRGLRLMRTTDIGEHGHVRNEAPVFVDPRIAAGYLLNAGDLLLSRSGTLGRALLWGREHPAAVFAGYLVRFRPDPGRVDPRFLWYATQSAQFQRAVQVEATQSTIANFNARRYADLRLPVPPRDEQRRIAEFLDQEMGKLNELLRLKRVLLAKLGDHLRGRVHAALDGLPREGRLGYTGTWYSGGTPPKDEPEHWSGSLPWASTKDLGQDELEDTVDHVTNEAARRYSRVAPAGSLVIATRGMALAKRLPLAVTGREMAFNQDLKALVPSPEVDVAYLRVVLRGYESEVLAAVMESAHGTRRLETRHLKGLRIPIPDRNTQRRIVSEVREIEARNRAMFSALDRQLGLLGERREALITATVTGELDPSSYRASAVTA